MQAGGHSDSSLHTCAYAARNMVCRMHVKWTRAGHPTSWQVWAGTDCTVQCDLVELIQRTHKCDALAVGRKVLAHLQCVISSGSKQCGAMLHTGQGEGSLGTCPCHCMP
jgi:hypothetical protein